MKEGEDILRKEYNNNLINNKLIINIKHRISQEKWNKETKINSYIEISTTNIKYIL